MSSWCREVKGREKPVEAEGNRRIASVAGVILALTIFAVGCASENARSADVPSTRGGGKSIVVAAGDIASCASSGDEATADLLATIDGTVVTLGDNAYEQGSAENYRECYDPTWGRFKHRTLPVPGNHEYLTRDAEG
jgi:hypothetical protein